jgi:hypothetical protein
MNLLALTTTTYNTDENRQSTKIKCGGALSSLALAGAKIYHGYGYDIGTIATVTGAALSVAYAARDFFSYGDLPPIPSQKIKNGYGEFVVFREDHGEVDKETYLKVYEIFNDHSLAAIAKRNAGVPNVADIYKNRTESIKEKVKAIDSTLKIAFIPRTLYDLILLNKCIKEDVKNDYTACPLLDQPRWGKMKKTREKCWHANYFPNQGNNNSPDVKDVAFRLNRSIAKNIIKYKTGCTFGEFLKATNKEIKFLEDFAQTDTIVDVKHLCRNQGPAYRFHSKARMERMALKSERQAQIIRNAVAFECSTLAQVTQPIYRSSDNKKGDTVVESTDEGDVVRTKSFGTSLFAGALHDPGASVITYTHQNPSYDFFIIPVPVSEHESGPVFIPQTNAICQFSGYGESFHARTRAWKGFDVKKVLGVDGVIGEDIYGDHLKSDLSKEQLKRKFEEYKSKSINL